MPDMVAADAASAYEALQLYKSKISRLRVASKFDEALALTCHAAVLQLKHGYENSANELGSLFVDILTESKFALTPEFRNHINEMANSFQQVPNRGVPFLQECLSLSRVLGPRLHGDTLLHRQLAVVLWHRGGSQQGEDVSTTRDAIGKEESVDDFKNDAVLHFAYGEAPEELWSQIAEDATLDPAQAPWTGGSRRERVVLLGVLYFLSLENLRDANILFNIFKKHRGQSKGKESALFEFTERLLLTSLRDARQLFQQLVTAYRAHLGFHPVVLDLLEGPIAKKLFGIQPAPNMMSLFANMFG